MPALSPQHILRVAETGRTEDGVGRALTILAAASPGVSRETLARLPLGTRDARLLAVREDTFGPVARGVADCAACAERVEFELDLPAMRRDRAAAEEGALDVPSGHLRFRPPNSEDVAAAAAAFADADGARVALARRCVVEARRDGALVAEPDLSPDVVDRIAVAVLELDPQAEILLDHRCPACGHAGQTLFDVASFVWEELRAEARRLLVEVHALARAYGWSEADILAMSAVRRRSYLELCG